MAKTTAKKTAEEPKKSAKPAPAKTTKAAAKPKKATAQKKLVAEVKTPDVNTKRPAVNTGKQTFLNEAIAEKHLIGLGFSVDAKRTGAGHFVYTRGIGVNRFTATVNRSIDGVSCEITKG